MSSRSAQLTPFGARRGARHWPGAGPDHLMTHLAIWSSIRDGQGGPETEGGEPVADADNHNNHREQ